MTPTNDPGVTERLRMFLEILAAMGGMSDASDSPWAWTNAFCGSHEQGEPDTFNRAIDLGYTRSTHDTDTDMGMVFLTDQGRAFLAAPPLTRSIPQAWINRADQIERSANALVSHVCDAMQRAQEGSGRFYAANIIQCDEAVEQILEALNLEEATFPAPARPAAKAPLPADVAELINRTGRAEWGATDAFDADGHGRHVADSVRITAAHFGQTEPQRMQGLYVEGTETVICHVGTSPNSPAVARALAGAWNHLCDLAAKVEG